jgi:hypothetical protein
MHEVGCRRGQPAIVIMKDGKVYKNSLRLRP